MQASHILPCSLSNPPALVCSWPSFSSTPHIILPQSASTNTWDVLSHWSGIGAQNHPVGINSAANGIFLDEEMCELFQNLTLYLEPPEVRHTRILYWFHLTTNCCYFQTFNSANQYIARRADHVYSPVDHIWAVSFSSTTVNSLGRLIEPLNAQYLALHAALSKVLHISTAGRKDSKNITRWWEDRHRLGSSYCTSD